MKNEKRLVLLAVTVLIVGGVAGMIIARRHTARGTPLHAGKAETGLSQARPEVQSMAAPVTPEPVPREATVSPENPRPLNPIKASERTNAAPRNAAAQASKSGPSAKEPLRDPMAREALAWVGADPQAEAYWYGAINDASLPPNERQDLIEDLNEDGLPDPKHPTADDLPLIVNRLLLIEAVGPDAMDKVNADAFQEAYRDLVNLANLAIGGGEPVR